MAAVVHSFGQTSQGQPVRSYSLENKNGARAVLIDYGAALQSLCFKDRRGEPVDLVQGFDSVEGYENQDAYIGATIGRVANRIGGSRFSLGGKEYRLYPNDGENHLHGGKKGFDKFVWQSDTGEDFVRFSRLSPHGEEGYPGRLTARVTYRLSGGALRIDYAAVSDRDTLCNLTNHTYFNLSGHQSGPVLEQSVQLFASAYTPTDAGSIPTGEVAPVEGTPMDLRAGLPIGARVDEDFPQLTLAGGYDHNWAVDGPAGTLRPAARAWSPATGITLEVSTTLPGVQFYSGNYLDGCPAGKGGAPYARRWGFCLETQFFPDAIHHPNFLQPVLRPGETWAHTTVFQFSAQP